MKKTLLALSLAAALAASAGTAFAQQTPDASPAVKLAQGATSVPGLNENSGAPTGTPPQIAARPSDRDLLPFAATLNGLGIDMHALLLNFFMTNPSTGVNTGRTGNSGILILGSDVDLGKLAGLNGGFFHIEEAFFVFKHNVGSAPNSFAGDVGSYMAGQPFPNNTPPNYLSLLTYEQHLMGDRLQLEAGRMNASRYFELQNCENIATCLDPIAQFTADIAPPPFATWGGRAKYLFNDKQFAQFGVFEDHFSEVNTQGWDWTTRNATGALIMGEYGYRSSFANARFPFSYELIGFYNTSNQSDPAYGAFGRSKVLFPGNPADTRRGTGGAMFRWQKFVWRDDDGATADLAPRSLALFGTVSGTPDPMQPYRAYAEVGTTLFAPFAHRPFDRISAKVSYVRVGGHELDFQQDARAVSGGPDVRTSPNEFRLEIDGHFAIAKAVALEPMVQYIVNPDTFNNPFSAHVPHSGFVVGVTLIASLGDLLGISMPPPH
ncbi:carbohydrate porin [Paraburkholderia sp. J67]|uniref:carbohydrate porin n=1 Tax=Paraburkholderia sp. J67 TaxID=2805435 RepID=UPI002ABD159F|nr:carbohydrate porin [Paraburkholderia sp. J67]